MSIQSGPRQALTGRSSRSKTRYQCNTIKDKLAHMCKHDMPVHADAAGKRVSSTRYDSINNRQI